MTRIPLFKAKELGDGELASSMAAFPLVGLVLGFGLALFHLVLGSRLPGALEGFVLTGLLVWATGGLPPGRSRRYG